MNDQETTVPATAEPRPSEYPIYKPNNRGSGGVIRFELNPRKGALFVEGAAQSGEKQFDWEQKLTMKWGLSDIGAILAVLQGRQPQAKLFHQTERANSAFEVVERTEAERAPYLMTLSRQDAASKVVRKITIPVTHAEAALLEALLRSATVRILGW